MGTFADSVVGNDDKLVRNAIRSVNYVAGSAGWKISAAGTAEFSGVTVRGDVVATSFKTDLAPNARVEIDSTALGELLIYPGTVSWFSLRARGFHNTGTQYVGAVEIDNIHPTQGRPRFTVWSDSAGATDTVAQIDIEGGAYVLVKGTGAAAVINGAHTAGYQVQATGELDLLATAAITTSGATSMTLGASGAVSLASSAGTLTLAGVGAVSLSSSTGALTLAGAGAVQVYSTTATLDLTGDTATSVQSSTSTLTLAAQTNATLQATTGTLLVSGAGAVTVQSTGSTVAVSGAGAVTVTSTGSTLALSASGALTLAGSYVGVNNALVLGTNQDVEMQGGAIVAGTSVIVGIGSVGSYTTRLTMQLGQTTLEYSDYAAVNWQWQHDGNVVAYQSAVAVWNAGIAISDEKVKRNIRDYPGKVVPVIQQLRPVLYQFDPAKLPLAPTGDRFGLIAQAVQAVWPEAVTAIGDSLLLDPLALALLALAGVKELADQVATTGRNGAPGGMLTP